MVGSVATLGSRAVAQVEPERSAGQESPTGARVESLSLRGGDDRAEITIRGSLGTPAYAVRSRDEGRVVVVEVEGASMPTSGVSLVGEASLIARSTTSQSARGVLLELQTRHPVAYHASVVGGRLVVRLDRLADGEGVPVAGPALESAEREDGATPLSVRRVSIERRDGRERVIVQLSRGAEFRVLPGATGPARLEITGASVSPDADRDVEIAGGSLVHAATIREAAGRTVIEVEREDGAQGTAIREGNRIVWLFAPGELAAEDGRPHGRTIARETDYRAVMASADGIDPAALEGMDSDEAAAFLTDVPLQVDAARGRRSYRGRRIDLDFNNADIHNILRLLAEVGGVNIVTSDDVTGNVTIRMRNVPWDQALEVILQAKGLGMVRRGNLIRVAPLETLEKERELAISRRKQLEDLAPLETRLVPVSYATAGELEERVQELLSQRGSVSVDERTNVLIVRDIGENLDDIEELVRTLDTQTPQVLVEARIVEATSTYVRDVGIQWGGDVTMNTITGNPTGLIFPANVGVVGGNYDANSPTAGLSPFTRTVATPNYAVNLPATTGTGQGGALGLTLGALGGAVNLNVRLSAAEANGVVRIISSPRILTLDNHEAHIAQGTLIPYSQISAQGVQTAFQEAILQLRVRPHVTADGSVSMHVAVTRDEPDFNRTSTRGDPTILKRNAETDLLIEDGHTAVIGGIYTRNTGRQVDQIPFFGDIPILGVLFQRRRVRDERNELLIFLTPRIVNRAEALRH
ncbi:MAG: type IV pilus secretin PilQ [Sandaracinaceae bacterium]|nr:type IV pilus secretin PilQ [Sandaracinaceae bacterium]